MKFNASMALTVLLVLTLVVLVALNRIEFGVVAMSDDGTSPKDYLDLIAVILAIALLILQILKEIRNFRD